MENSIEPAGLRLAVRVERGYIRFDIQKRCTIKQIHILNLKSVPFNSNEPDNRQPDRIRPLWCPRGKYAVGCGINSGISLIYHGDIRAAEKIAVSRKVADALINGKGIGMAGCPKATEGRSPKCTCNNLFFASQSHFSHSPMFKYFRAYE